MIELQVLIATYGQEGLERLAKAAASGSLPQTEGVEYLMSCQMGKQEEIPGALQRKDIRIIFSKTKGLSRNRNILLKAATAPFCLIADDDLSYTSAALLSIISTLKSNPDVDIATFISANYQEKEGPVKEKEGPAHSQEDQLTYEKQFPNESFDLCKPAKGYYVTSFEIAFRREAVESAGILFNENFGVGAPLYGAGEEELWIHQLLAKGLRGRFFPQQIVVHHGPTTGTREAANPRVLRAQGVVIPVLYPLTGFPRILLKAYRSSRVSGASLPHCLRHILRGYLDLLLHHPHRNPQSDIPTSL